MFIFPFNRYLPEHQKCILIERSDIFCNLALELMICIPSNIPKIEFIQNHLTVMYYLIICAMPFEWKMAKTYLHLMEQNTTLMHPGQGTGMKTSTMQWVQCVKRDSLFKLWETQSSMPNTSVDLIPVVFSVLTIRWFF